METLSSITFDPNLYYGKPIFRGTRIPVYCVLELIAEGVSFQEIVEKHYPVLSVEQIQEAVRLAAWLLKDEGIPLRRTPLL